MSITAGYGGDCLLSPYLGYVSHIHHLPPLYNGRLIAIDGRWGQITSQAMLYISFIVSKGIPLLFSIFFCEIIVSRFSDFFCEKKFPTPPSGCRQHLISGRKRQSQHVLFSHYYPWKWATKKTGRWVNSPQFSQNMGVNVPKGLMPGMQWSAVQYSQRSPPSEP